MTPSEARGIVTDRIEALTPGAYGQGATAWVQSLVPLVPEFEPEPKAHLSFFVDDRDLSLNASRQGANGELLMVGVMRVRFLVRLRPNSRVADWDGASDAAQALWKHLLAESGDWNEDITIHPVERGFCTRSVVGDAAFCVVTLAFVAEYFTEAV